MERGYKDHRLQEKEMLSKLGTTTTANIQDDLRNNHMRGKGLAEKQNSTFRNNFQNLNSPHSCGESLFKLDGAFSIPARIMDRQSSGPQHHRHGSIKKAQ